MRIRQHRTIRYLDYLIARVTQRGRYQVVATLNGEVVAFRPTTRHAAIQNWRWRIASGCYAIGTGNSARVMSVAEARKAGVR